MFPGSANLHAAASLGAENREGTSGGAAAAPDSAPGSARRRFKAGHRLRFRPGAKRTLASGPDRREPHRPPIARAITIAKHPNPSRDCCTPRSCAAVTASGEPPRACVIRAFRFARHTEHCELFRSSADNGASQSRHSPCSRRSSRYSWFGCGYSYPTRLDSEIESCCFVAFYEDLENAGIDKAVINAYQISV